jgi:hypothetical protein
VNNGGLIHEGLIFTVLIQTRFLGKILHDHVYKQAAGKIALKLYVYP